MAFQKKSYQEIVEDIVERISKGSVREKYQYDPTQTKYKLANGPVKDLVKTEGLHHGARHVFQKGRDYRQTGDMLEWVPKGSRPDNGTPFYVNYVFDEPSGITDVNPGSVVRTIVEAVSREIGLIYEEIDQVYRSAFIDTANGTALDMVVSLLGMDRTPPQNATGQVVFGRAAPPEQINVNNEIYVFDGKLAYELKTQPVSRITGLKGVSHSRPLEFDPKTDFILDGNTLKWLQEGKKPDEGTSFNISYIAFRKIIVPAGITVTTSSRDPQAIRAFTTTEEKPLLPQLEGNWEATVAVRSNVPGRKGNVPAGSIQLMPKPPVGVEYVINKQDILTGVDEEADEQLRARAKKALEAAGKATLVSIESSIRRIEGVRSILIQDRPDNVPGIIRVVVDGGETEVIRNAIEETRSAGICVEFQRPRIATVDANATIIALKGAFAAKVQSGVEERLRAHLSRLQIGDDIVYSRLTATILDDKEIYDLEDLTVAVRREGEAPFTTTGENVLMSRDERAQVRNVNISVKVKE
jgi:Baseplate J-like protein